MPGKQLASAMRDINLDGIIEIKNGHNWKFFYLWSKIQFCYMIIINIYGGRVRGKGGGSGGGNSK